MILFVGVCCEQISDGRKNLRTVMPTFIYQKCGIISNATISCPTLYIHWPLRCLLHFDGNINASDKDKGELYTLSGTKYFFFLCIFFSCASVNIDVVYIRLLSALHRAAEWGHFNVVTILLERRATIGVLSEDGETSLEVAKRCNHVNVEKVMLDCHVISEANYEN
jgi:hypothetical protein